MSVNIFDNGMVDANVHDRKPSLKIECDDLEAPLLAKGNNDEFTKSNSDRVSCEGCEQLQASRRIWNWSSLTFGLFGGVLAQYLWYRGILLTLVTLSTVFTASAAFGCVLTLLFVKFCLVNYAVLTVIGPTELGETLVETEDDLLDHTTTSPIAVPHKICCALLAAFEALTGFVVGMFFTALALELIQG